MRVHGNLTKWNDDRGFGFISPANGGADVFVHISAFPRDNQRPTLNELISYESETTKDGKARAVRIMRPGQRDRTSHPKSGNKAKESNGIVGTILVLLAVAAIAAYGYTQIKGSTGNAPSSLNTATQQSAPSPFTCDGRTMCSQMTSCAEAVYFLKHCPNTKMDGNSDGEPCESQWCN